jgi:hypothetical protein
MPTTHPYSCCERQSLGPKPSLRPPTLEPKASSAPPFKEPQLQPTAGRRYRGRCRGRVPAPALPLPLLDLSLPWEGLPV